MTATELSEAREKALIKLAEVAVKLANCRNEAKYYEQKLSEGISAYNLLLAREDAT